MQNERKNSDGKYDPHSVLRLAAANLPGATLHDCAAASWMTQEIPLRSDTQSSLNSDAREQFISTQSKCYQGQHSGGSQKAATYDDGKSPLAWLPWRAIDALSRVQMYGGRKYKDYNNYRKGMEVSRNLSCALRHIRDYLEGHDIDKESGESPLAHAMCRLAFVLQNIAEGTAIDDRYKPYA